ncbi:MAG: class I SAM-dependent methyltransferase [Gammaproteobacteria bacterium]|nr:class I SAM-dependent methyltransferase [Gammaproteobacteria bacterium]
MKEVRPLGSEQAQQEGEYWFPYHYVGQFQNDNFKHFYLDTWAINYVSTIEFLLRKVELDAPQTIIDIGCGDGRFSRELALASRDRKVLGVDYSQRAIGLATAMNADVENVSFLSLDISGDHELQLFESAILMEVFEHIPLNSTADFLAGVRRIIKPGGILHLTVPHENKPLDDMHYQHFTIEKIRNCLQKNFEVIEVVPFEKMGISRRVVLKLLSNKFFILNNSRLLRFIYRYYKNRLFIPCTEENCQRIYVKAKAL